MCFKTRQNPRQYDLLPQFVRVFLASHFLFVSLEENLTPAQLLNLATSSDERAKVQLFESTTHTQRRKITFKVISSLEKKEMPWYREKNKYRRILQPRFRNQNDEKEFPTEKNRAKTMNRVQQILLCTALVICQLWTGTTGMVPGLMDLLNIGDATTFPTTAEPTWPPTKPGQVNPHACAKTKYGCCKDSRTPSPGPNKEGCAKELCYDDYPGDCLIKKMTNQLDCRPGEYDYKHCPYRCKVCKPLASPVSRCWSLNPLFGCCWDGTIPLDRYGKGCRPCEDVFPHACQQFAHVAGGCDSGSLGIRNFMVGGCPKTCGLCAYGL